MAFKTVAPTSKPNQRAKSLSSTFVTSDSATGHALLLRAGFICPGETGTFHYLPLGLRVLDNITGLIEKHMKAIGASKVSLSSLSSESVWRKSGRLKDQRPSDKELFAIEDRKGSGLLLCPTHEEAICQAVRPLVTKYRDVPLLLYQITNKYRDELRPRHGLLRTKEFLMKDLYSFDASPTAALETYINVLTAYKNLFVDLGVPFLVSEASSGDMGGPMSHEFHFESELGEDIVWTCDTCSYSANDEVADRKAQSGQERPVAEKEIKVWYGVSKDKATKIAFVYPGKKDTPSTLADLNLRIVKQLYPELDASIDEQSTRNLETNFAVVIQHPQVNSELPDIWGTSDSSAPENAGDIATSVDVDFTSIQPDDPCPRCESGKLSKHRTIEVGHTFYLGTKYSLPLGVAIKRGDSKIKDPLHMGCYGIGVSRILGAIARLYSSTAQLQNEGPGIHWPATIAPYDVVVLPNSYLELRSGALEIYDKLTKPREGSGAASVVIDDRSESLGYRFTDADLRGFPVLVVLGKRWPDAAEVQYRHTPLMKRKHKLVPRAEVPSVASQLLQDARERQKSAAASSLGPVQVAAMLEKLESALDAANEKPADSTVLKGQSRLETGNAAQELGDEDPSSSHKAEEDTPRKL